MIGFLKGKVIDKGKAITIVCEDVGYEVFVSKGDMISIKEGEKYSIWIREVSSDRGVSLYGFLNKDERSLFDMLTTVSGIGPKTAIGILSLAESKELITAILKKDVTLLTKGLGVPKRHAEKLVVELSSKIAQADDVSLGDFEEILDALVGLGYDSKKAREVSLSVSREEGSIEEKIAKALKVLSK